MRMVVVLVGLAACGAKGHGAGGRPRPAVEVVVSDAGVGRITTELLLGEDPTGRFVALMPGWTFTEERDTAEDHDVSVITGSRDGADGLRIVLNHYRASQPIVSVSARDPRFGTAKGVSAGMTVGEAAAVYPALACRLEVYDPEADVLRVERRCFCEAPELALVSFELAPAACAQEGTAPVTKLPVAGLAATEIVALDWVPAEAVSEP